MDNKILIAVTLNDFLVYDPLTAQLSNVYRRNNIGQTYFGGIFTYNNILHLNADLLSTTQMVYEISIEKGR